MINEGIINPIIAPKTMERPPNTVDIPLCLSLNHTLAILLVVLRKHTCPNAVIAEPRHIISILSTTYTNYRAHEPHTRNNPPITRVALSPYLLRIPITIKFEGMNIITKITLCI